MTNNVLTFSSFGDAATRGCIQGAAHHITEQSPLQGQVVFVLDFDAPTNSDGNRLHLVYFENKKYYCYPQKQKPEEFDLQKYNTPLWVPYYNHGATRPVFKKDLDKQYIYFRKYNERVHFMATTCTPGYKGLDSDSSSDTLKPGCWAENTDGSLLFVKDISKKNQVIYTLYDSSQEPIMGFDDMMPSDEFKEFFSYVSKASKKVKDNKWTWHDKTKFPWHKVIKQGAKSTQIATANNVLNLAQRISKALKLPAKDVGAIKQEVAEILSNETHKKSIIAKLKKVLQDWE